MSQGKRGAFPGRTASSHSTACQRTGEFSRGWKGNRTHALTKPRAWQTPLCSRAPFCYGGWLGAGEKGKASFARCWFSVWTGNSSTEHIRGEDVFGSCALWLLQGQSPCCSTNSCYTVWNEQLLEVLGHNNSTATGTMGWGMGWEKPSQHFTHASRSHFGLSLSCVEEYIWGI